MTPQLAAPETSTVAKLLLNAWSAEFALRIRPASSDREFLNNSLNWAFPQCYYAALFSARAVLAIDGIYIANPEAIKKLMKKWAGQGLYGPNFTREKNQFADLLEHRIKSTPSRFISGPEAAALHVKLTEKVHALAIIHETYILNRLGAEAYKNLVETLPDYLKNGFVGARATFLLSEG